MPCLLPSCCCPLCQEEETTVLPQLAAVVSADTLLQLGIQFEASKVRLPQCHRVAQLVA